MRRSVILGSALMSLALTSGAAAAERSALNPAIAERGWTPPKNAFGQPDLSGYWTNATLTPLTRNRAITDKPTLSRAEANRVEAIFNQALARDNEPTPADATTATFRERDNNPELIKIRPDFGGAEADIGGYNSAWLDPGAHFMEVGGELRTSILTTPDGQPPKRKDGKATTDRGDYAGYSYDSYETLSLGERCIMGFGRNAGPPMLPNGYYNNSYYFIQTADAVAIQVEMIHDLRIVRLKGGHRMDGLRPWMGDSIGRWEGNTLVVETTNFPQKQAFFGSWKNLKVTERFTRISPKRINYQFQVEDPDTWRQPWGGEYNFSPMDGVIYEYACHEGNYALPGILAGARHQEKERSDSKPQAATAGAAQ